MTTIAYDGRYLVADGRSTIGGQITGKNTQKVFPIDLNLGESKVRGVFAGAGAFETVVQVKQHLERADLFEPEFIPEIAAGEFGGLLILETGEVYELESKLVPLPVEFPVSIGSGSQFASAAMVAGKTAIGAVEIAKELDCFSGGKSRVFDTSTWSFLED